MPFRGFTRRVLLVALGTWIMCMTVLYFDAMSVDWATLITLLVAMFGFILNISAHQSKTDNRIRNIEKYLSIATENAKNKQFRFENWNK